MTVFPAKNRYVINEVKLAAEFPNFADILVSRTGKKPVAIEMIKKGQGNIFRVETPAEAYALNILFMPGYPRKPQLESVYSLLDKHSIEHPRLEHFDDSAEIFPYGFMLHSWITGVDAQHKGESWLDHVIDALAPLQ